MHAGSCVGRELEACMVATHLAYVKFSCMGFLEAGGVVVPIRTVLMYKCSDNSREVL